MYLHLQIELLFYLNEMETLLLKFNKYCRKRKLKSSEKIGKWQEPFLAESAPGCRELNPARKRLHRWRLLQTGRLHVSLKHEPLSKVTDASMNNHIDYDTAQQAAQKR